MDRLSDGETDKETNIAKTVPTAELRTCDKTGLLNTNLLTDGTIFASGGSLIS